LFCFVLKQKIDPEKLNKIDSFGSNWFICLFFFQVALMLFLGINNYNLRFFLLLLQIDFGLVWFDLV